MFISKIKKYYLLVSIVFLFVFSWLSLGVYEEPEWGEQMLFLKHRPSFHWFFSVPLGEYCPYVESLSEAGSRCANKNDRLYIEFINEQKGSNRSVFFVPSLWFLFIEN